MIDSTLHHRPWEDALAILIGVSLTSLGIQFYSDAQILIGSTAGLALLVSYITGWGFGPIFFVVNIPFYWLAFRRMGLAFTFKTFMAIGLLSLFSMWMPGWIGLSHIHPLYAALVGGCLIGLGILALFRHRGSLGGINILALYLQDRHIARAGHIQLVIDISLMVAALFVLPLDKVAYSVVGAVVLNAIVLINHRPERYRGES
ncbi:YitT family protein [Larsenimonas rhizosphaerae]|uniref:YitT family protein n=1 Tax=Larsenimonas rhizosphaerae TaxID=2944682 RepID=A0AA41ZIV3_9GAMM|nr:YitT family protein [Larsenimonas rhizosphaerae]MCM2131645.1 YitT family protein [Larsenimonas rhizosphaerae]MCX2525029.1 YitT family protein [Larsenimonas rhizosphaerae]